MKAQCIRYTAADFHVDRFSSVFENQLQSWWTDFGFLPVSAQCRFSLACFSIYWVIAEWETQVCLSCKITPDTSAVSESGEEGGKNPKSVDQLYN